MPLKNLRSIHHRDPRENAISRSLSSYLTSGVATLGRHLRPDRLAVRILDNFRLAVILDIIFVDDDLFNLVIREGASNIRFVKSSSITAPKSARRVELRRLFSDCGQCLVGEFQLDIVERKQLLVLFNPAHFWVR